MPFKFLHRPPSKRSKDPWYDNALLLTIAGSIIVVIGQLAGTVIPIMCGPQDISDFNIDLDPMTDLIDVKNSAPDGQYVNVNITIEDLHKFLRPYIFKIQFKASGPINDTYVTFDPPYIKLPRSIFEFRKPVNSTYWYFGKPRSMPPDTTTVCIYIAPNSTFIGNYPIIIQGIGSNEKTHNSTFTLSIVSHEDYLKCSNGTPLNFNGDEIHK